MNDYIIEKLLILSCNIDDFNPQNYEYISQKLFEHNALDVWLTPIYMKKSRSANTLSVLIRPEDKENCLDIIFSETTTLGIREKIITRYSLDREFKSITTPYGQVKCKIAKKGDKILNISAEYEDCKQLAQKHNVPLKTIQQTALFLANEELKHFVICSKQSCRYERINSKRRRNHGLFLGKRSLVREGNVGFL